MDKVQRPSDSENKNTSTMYVAMFDISLHEDQLLYDPGRVIAYVGIKRRV
jgi:hypothetical protein